MLKQLGNRYILTITTCTDVDDNLTSLEFDNYIKMRFNIHLKIFKRGIRISE